MAGKYKGESEHDVTFVEGGNEHMFGKQAAGPDKPGNTGKDQSSAPGAKFAKGGSGKMHGFTPAEDQKPGRTSAC